MQQNYYLKMKKKSSYFQKNKNCETILLAVLPFRIRLSNNYNLHKETKSTCKGDYMGINKDSINISSL